MFRLGRLLPLCLCVAAWTGPAGAGTEEAVRALERVGLVSGAAERAAAVDEIAEAGRAFEDAATFETVTRALAALADLSESAVRPSTRVRASELQRQLLEEVLPAPSGIVARLRATDPVVHPVAPGRDITEADLGWMILMAALRDAPDADPARIEIDDATAGAALREIRATIAEASEPVLYAIAHAEAWGAGVVAAWDDLDLAARRQLVGRADRTEPVPPELLERVIGTDDVLRWIGGVEIGLTPAERVRHPELVAYLEAYALAGGEDGFVVRTLLARRAADAAVRAQGDMATSNMVQGYLLDLMLGSGAPDAVDPF
jgi:hypothetical protein